LLWEIEKKYEEKIVILVDNFDKPILDVLDNQEQAIKHRDLIVNFFSILK